MRQLFLAALSVGVTFAAAANVAKVTPAPWWRITAFAVFTFPPTTFAAILALLALSSFERAAAADKGQKI